jgi:hypothetical protein
MVNAVPSGSTLYLGGRVSCRISQNSTPQTFRLIFLILPRLSAIESAKVDLLRPNWPHWVEGETPWTKSGKSAPFSIDHIPNPTKEQLLGRMHTNDRQMCDSRDSPAGQVEAIFDFHRKQWKEELFAKLSESATPPEATNVLGGTSRTPKEERDDELLQFMPKALREEYDTLRESVKQLFGKQTKNF